MYITASHSCTSLGLLFSFAVAFLSFATGIIPKLVKFSPETIFLVVSNPGMCCNARQHAKASGVNIDI